MSNYHCYLCASDDGIQLDIFGVGGKAICEKIESCLSVKIEESNAISTKICHKCAFELDACNKFVAKYRQARDSKKGKSNTVKRHCSLCLEPGKIGYIFECKLGNPINDILHKVQEIFNDNNFNDKRRTLSICLDCRYNLDVLFDLKCIYQSTPDKLRRLREASLQLSELPKTKTRVVNRKTTYIPVSRLNSTEGYDTDSSSVTSIMSYKRKRGRPRKDSEPTSPSIFRTCEQCETSVENGLDMYRYHRTGMTVCKDCWLAMDPEKVTHNKRKKLGLAGGDVGTRRCAIILKDVLTNPAKYENIYKVEKDEHGNTTFIVTDDSSENEEREKTPAKRSRRNHGSVASVDLTPVKRDRPPKRTVSTKSTDLDDEPPAKIRDRRKKIVDDVTSAKTKDKVKKIDVEKPPTTRSTRTRNGLAVSDTEVFESRTRRRLVGQSTDNEKNSKAASDAELTKPLAKKRSPRTRLEKSEPADSSSSETKTVATTKDRKSARNAAPVVSTTDSVERPVRRTRAQSLSSKDATLPTSRLSKVSKSVSEAESSPTKIKRTKTKSLSPKNSASELEVENPYTCTVCLVEYRNKLIGMKHELTHAKQPEVKLQRVAIPETIVEEAPAESSLIEEPEEQSHDVSSTSENQPGDSENVETSVPVASQEEASIDVLANENKENLEESKSLPEVDETATKIDEKEEIMEDKITDNMDEKEDRIEDKASENEVDETIKKTQDKTEETEDKIEDKTEETEDKIEDETEETEDKTEDKTEETEEKIEDKTEETEDKTEDKTEETEDKTEDKTDEIKDKTENKKDETEDKAENETDETEDKTENKTDETEDKTENKMDDTEDKTENQNDETEDNTEDKMNETEDTIENEMNETEDTIENEKDETEDKTENKMDETEDKTENEMDETEDKTENKMDETEDKTEEKTDAPEVAEAETTVENKNCDENNVENSRQDEENDISTIAESDKNNEDEETEITALIAADSKTPESTLNDEIEKEVESTELVEKFSEEVLNESEELSENLNGVNVDDEPNSEVNNANGVEKNAIAVNNDAESKTVDDSTREKSIEPDDVPSVTSTAPEMDNEVQDVVKDKISSDEEDTAKDLEEEPEAATTEDTIAPEINTTKDSEESESIVSDVLTEVFDLATAEVQKRMENEPSRDEKCTTPVSETLENISREISNSADMPSLEPLVDNQSSNIQS